MMTKEPTPHKEYNNIDELVFRYQEGCEESGEEILRIFGCHPESQKMTLYVGKYYSMLRYGKISFSDKDSRRFIACFMVDSELRKKMIPFYQYRDVKEEARRTLEKVVSMLSVVEDDDFKQDLRMLLLQQAIRYQKTKKSVDFTGYLYNSYRYAVKNYIESMFRRYEPYMHMRKNIIQLEDDKAKDETSGIELGEVIFAEEPMIKAGLDDELGNSWVRGLTCGEEFKDVTQLQRLILKLHFHDGVTDGKIADMMGVHINTIFRQRKRACEIIEQAVERLIEEGYYQ